MKNRAHFLLGAIIVPWLFVAAAISAESRDPAHKEGNIRGDFALWSSLAAEAVNDSNIFQSASDERSSHICKLKPSVLLRYKPARSRVELGYTGDFGWYHSSGRDNYTDHALKAGAYLLMGERSGLDVVASYDAAHEGRGAGLTQGYDVSSAAFPQSPDRYTTGQLVARYTYGVARSRAYVSLDGSTQALRYQNNAARTRQFDRNEASGQLTLGLRVSPRTSLELRAQARDVAYDLARPVGQSRDSKEHRYQLGVVWEATANTTGSIHLGQLDKRFSDPARAGFSGLSWDVAVRFSPRSYSEFALGTRRYTEEPVDLLGDVTDTSMYSLDWRHEWNDRLATKIGLSQVDRTYRYAAGDRTDQSPHYTLGVDYQMRRWLHWEAGVDLNARHSTVARYGYDQTIARIGARISL